jgi:hypothetical protein
VLPAWSSCGAIFESSPAGLPGGQGRWSRSIMGMPQQRAAGNHCRQKERERKSSYICLWFAAQIGLPAAMYFPASGTPPPALVCQNGVMDRVLHPVEPLAICLTVAESPRHRAIPSTVTVNGPLIASGPRDCYVHSGSTADHIFALCTISTSSSRLTLWCYHNSGTRICEAHTRELAARWFEIAF